MKGLILKDFLILKNKIKLVPIMVLALIVGIAIYFFNSTGVLVTNVFLPLFFCSMPIPIFLEDEKAKWHTYALSTPISKVKIIISRYITSFSIILIITFISTLFNLFYFYFFSPYSLGVHMLTIFLSFFISTLYLSLLIPSVYQNGANGGSTVMVILIFLFSAITYLINAQFVPIHLIIHLHPILIIISFMLVMAFAVLISIYISIKIFSKK
ncbi:ABC-2 transporter permease [Fervidibacillus albus]|uniref:ABC-2 transporter permease n=1 Tax=Fervidibacillus albus TaxID=2980026 RepID=A0A9E8LTW6_9BACI|nr:ABC-2 transporter permease [Fervidibacillus albus]WAA09565.1 ABC-2 transporter permease [Fervidibacillus albus]